MSNTNRDRVAREREDTVCAECQGILRWQVRQYRHMRVNGELYITTHAPKPIECSPQRWMYCTQSAPKPVGGEA